MDAMFDSLFFTGYKHRQDEIAAAEDDTFTWIHEHNAPGHVSDAPGAATFSTWVQRAPEVFWIKGKAGSGKSTIMKRLVNSNTTLRMLSQVDITSEVYIASYFWYQLSGHCLQNTIEGALRSLIYQILKQDNQIAMQVAMDILPTDSLRSGKIADWTFESLIPVIDAVLSNARKLDKRLCLFVDGLDEIAIQDQATFGNILKDLHRDFPEVFCAFPAGQRFFCDNGSWIPVNLRWPSAMRMT